MRKSPQEPKPRKHRLIVPLLVCWSVAMTSAGTAGDVRHAGSALFPAFDVLHYTIAVTLDMVGGMLSGRVTMTARLNSATHEIVLNAACLTIDQATVNGEIWSTSVDSLQETLTLRAPGAGRAAGETVSVAIDYRRLPEITRPGGRWGYYFFRDTIGLPSNLGYTMAEPSDARFWMPCVDTPTDKASAELFVTVPAGYVAASNGTLLGVTPAPGNTVDLALERVAPDCDVSHLHYRIAVLDLHSSLCTSPRGYDTCPVLRLAIGFRRVRRVSPYCPCDDRGTRRTLRALPVRQVWHDGHRAFRVWWHGTPDHYHAEPVSQDR